MTKKQKHYRAARALVLPQGLAPGPGATNMRLDPGDIFTVDDGPATTFGRFLNGRVHSGDIEEVDEKTAAAREAKAKAEAEAQFAKEQAAIEAASNGGKK